MNPSTSSFEYAQIWYESVLKNCRINKTTLHIDKPGQAYSEKSSVEMPEPFCRGCMDFGGMKRSYIGTATYQKGIKEG